MNYLRIKFSYSLIIIMPIEDGLKFIQSLSTFTIEDNRDYNKPFLRKVKSDDITITIVSEEEYENLKIAQVLDIEKK